MRGPQSRGLKILKTLKTLKTLKSLPRAVRPPTLRPLPQGLPAPAVPDGGRPGPPINH